MGIVEMDVDFGPLMIAISFYACVFVLAELTRMIVDRYVRAATLPYYFCIEAIATAQMCTCVYENAVIIRHYGPWGFFFMVTVILFAGSTMNRGAFVSPLVPIEMFYFKSIGLDRFLTVISAEAVGGYSAFRIARQLWYFSLSLANEHAVNYKAACAFSYKIPFVFVLFFEVIGCFLMRTILSRVPDNSKRYAAPAVVSAFLTIALVFVGVIGLNPTVASSRMHGCEGLNTQWFILAYWVCPVIGWMSSAIVDNRNRATILDKQK